jgi:predicted amidohydrolase
MAKPFSVVIAVANGVHVVSVIRVGLEQDGAMKFWGGSFISTHFGTVIHKASHDEEEIVVHEIDTDNTDRYRTIGPSARSEDRFLSARLRSGLLTRSSPKSGSQKV